MSMDTLIGFLLALPLYAFIMFLFRDIIVNRFIRNLIQGSSVEPVAMQDLSAPQFKEAIKNDLLTSYKLMLVLKDQYEDLITLQDNETIDPTFNKTMGSIYRDKLKVLNYTLDYTEKMFDDMGESEYKEVKQNINKSLTDKTLF